MTKLATCLAFSALALALSSLVRVASAPVAQGVLPALHNVAADSPGLYTVETQHEQRLQNFTYKGIGPVA
jgi:hypothetical protein